MRQAGRQGPGRRAQVAGPRSPGPRPSGSGSEMAAELETKVVGPPCKGPGAGLGLRRRKEALRLEKVGSRGDAKWSLMGARGLGGREFELSPKSRRGLWSAPEQPDMAPC